MDLQHPFVSCAVCQEGPQNTQLYLTSCAHLLCKEHASRNALDPHHLESTETRCSACGHDRVSLLKVDGRLPHDILPFFTPFPTQVEQLFSAAQFQYCGMAEKIQHQAQTIGQLVEKVNKQKQLLVLAKEKVSQINELETTVKRLETENARLRSRSTSSYVHPSLKDRNARQPPPTVDLTEDSFEEIAAQPQPKRRAVTKSFVDQVKKSSSQKAVPSLSDRYQYSTPRHQEQPSMTTLDFTKGKLAESTNIMRESPQHMHHQSRHQQQITPMTLSSNGGLTLSSHGSGSNNSFTSRSGDFMLPTTTKSSLQQAPQIRGAKSRATTSQLAQRLSAHMKVGSLQRAHSSTGARPGSSFMNPSPLFGKR